MSSNNECQHQFPYPLSELSLRCSWGFCRDQPSHCFVYIGPSVCERDCWVVCGTCSLHSDLVLARANSDRSDPKVPLLVMCPELRPVFDWIHTGGRCVLDCFSVTSEQITDRY
jgi:hypothetical protein